MSTLSLQKATDFTHATSADQNKPANLTLLIMDCTICYSVTSYFEIFPENDK
jgi:hypothetical protein